MNEVIVVTDGLLADNWECYQDEPRDEKVVFTGCQYCCDAYHNLHKDEYKGGLASTWLSVRVKS